MAQVSLGSRTMGAWDFAHDQSGALGACVVTILYNVLVDGRAVNGLADAYDVWPSLTQGERNQLSKIVARVQQICEAT